MGSRHPPRSPPRGWAMDTFSADAVGDAFAYPATLDWGRRLAKTLVCPIVGQLPVATVVGVPHDAVRRPLDRMMRITVP